jgi:serine/threonine protein kinase
MPNSHDRYEIIETLGVGATSRVDKARDRLIGRIVALKTLFSGLGSADLEKQFLREAQIIGSLAHPHIVSLYDVGFDGEGRPYFVMEYVEGKTLHGTLQAGPVPLKKAAAWAGDLATALAQAHQAEIIHGDLKPANVLVTREGKVKLGDFGVARFATHSSGSGNVMGTPAYLSPEQILGNTQDTRSDIFSLGVVLYEMTTGVRPFQGDSIVEVGGQILSFAPPPPSHHNSELPPDFDCIVMRCLAKNPVERYSTAEVLSSLLYPFARSENGKLRTEKNDSVWDQSLERVKSCMRNAPKVLDSSIRKYFATNAKEHTGWWTGAMQPRDFKIATIATLIVILLFPVARAVVSRSKMQRAERKVASPPVSSNALDTMAPPASTAPTVNVGRDSVIDMAEMNSQTVPEPANVPAVHSSDGTTTHKIVKHAAVQKAVWEKSLIVRNSEPKSAESTVPVTASERPVTAAQIRKPVEPTLAQETSLHIGVVSGVADGTLAVFVDNRQLLTVPLQSEHIGDTLRYDCLIEPGEHNLRVVLYRGATAILSEKQNDTDLRVGTPNAMEVRILRRSKLLVRHETSLEVTWPSNSLAPVSARSSGL